MRHLSFYKSVWFYKQILYSLVKSNLSKIYWFHFTNKFYIVELNSSQIWVRYSSINKYKTMLILHIMFMQLFTSEPTIVAKSQEHQQAHVPNPTTHKEQIKIHTHKEKGKRQNESLSKLLPALGTRRQLKGRTLCFFLLLCLLKKTLQK